MAFHKLLSRINHPWKLAPQEAVELVLGSLFRERVYVRDHELRDLMLPFCTSKGACPSVSTDLFTPEQLEGYALSVSC